MYNNVLNPNGDNSKLFELLNEVSDLQGLSEVHAVNMTTDDKGNNVFETYFPVPH